MEINLFKITRKWISIALCFSFCFATIPTFSFFGKSDAEEYDEGYEAAWEEEDEPSSWWVSKSKKEGYEDGAADAAMYAQGYYDGANGHRPKYWSDPFYKDGYEDGKEDS